MFSVDEMMRAGCTTRRGLRFWEEKGLLGTVDRSPGGTRRYTVEQHRRVRIIAAAQFGSFDLETAKKMLDEWGPEAHEAIVVRLGTQIAMAEMLLAELPKPAPIIEQQEYDL